MGILTFYYVVMGSSKSAQALITRFNYIKKGFNVILIKPSIDNRDDKGDYRVIKSRIGIEAQCEVFDKDENLISFCSKFMSGNKEDIIIVDEVQFCTKKQIEELKELSTKLIVLCYGLKTNFRSELFEGSKRLIEIADEFVEVEYICACGKKANINARLVDDKPIVQGGEIQIGDTAYKAMCYNCWRKMLR